MPYVFSQIAILGTILIEILAPVIIVIALLQYNKDLSYFLLEKSVYCLVGFTLLATLIYHPLNDKNELMNILKNLSIIGGLLLLLQV
jgi:uncharacterized membrane protein